MIHPIYPNRLLSYINIIKTLPSMKPLTVAFSDTDEIRDVISKVIRASEFDLIHTEFIRAAQWTMDITGFPKVFDAVDSLTLANKRAFYSRYTHLSHKILAFEEMIKMRRYEPFILHKYDYGIVSSPADQEYLINNGPTIEVLPDGVDLQYFSWGEKVDESDETLMFLGKMNYYVNIDSITYFTRFIYPIIKKVKPNIRLDIVGWNPTKAIRSMGEDPSITVVGAVSDIRPYLRKAKVLITPMVSGSGIQTKILQSMAIGTPVVSTSIATLALRVSNGDQILIGDQPDEFAYLVLSLLKDASLRKQISINARNYVEDHHNWEKIGDRLDQIYHSLM
jgi:glycosyltransferase involved in cell wall biosynthesis